MRTRVIGVRHDGAGRYPRQTLYSDDPGALARAEAADPGHVAPVLEYSPDGSCAWYATQEQARRAAHRRALAGGRQGEGE